MSVGRPPSDRTSSGQGSANGQLLRAMKSLVPPMLAPTADRRRGCHGDTPNRPLDQRL